MSLKHSSVRCVVCRCWLQWQPCLCVLNNKRCIIQSFIQCSRAGTASVCAANKTKDTLTRPMHTFTHHWGQLHAFLHLDHVFWLSFIGSRDYDISEAYLQRLFNYSASHWQFKACLEIFYEGAIARGGCDFNMSGFVATLMFFCKRLVHLQPYENNSRCKTHINTFLEEPVNVLFAACISLDYAMKNVFFMNSINATQVNVMKTLSLWVKSAINFNLNYVTIQKFEWSLKRLHSLYAKDNTGQKFGIINT